MYYLISMKLIYRINNIKLRKLRNIIIFENELRIIISYKRKILKYLYKISRIECNIKSWIKIARKI